MARRGRQTQQASPRTANPTDRPSLHGHAGWKAAVKVPSGSRPDVRSPDQPAERRLVHGHEATVAHEPVKESSGNTTAYSGVEASRVFGIHKQHLLETEKLKRSVAQRLAQVEATRVSYEDKLAAVQRREHAVAKAEAKVEAEAQALQKREATFEARRAEEVSNIESRSQARVAELRKLVGEAGLSGIDFVDGSIDRDINASMARSPDGRMDTGRSLGGSGVLTTPSSTEGNGTYPSSRSPSQTRDMQSLKGEWRKLEAKRRQVSWQRRIIASLSS